MRFLRFFFLRLGDIIFVIELGLTVNLEIVCSTVDGLIIIGGDDRIEKYVIYYINVQLFQHFRSSQFCG